MTSTSDSPTTLPRRLRAGQSASYADEALTATDQIQRAIAIPRRQRSICDINIEVNFENAVSSGIFHDQAATIRIWVRRTRLRTRELALILAGVVAAATMVSVANPLSKPAEAAGAVSIYQTASTFSGPFTIGHVVEPLTARSTDLGSRAYVEQKYSASGTAHAFNATSAPSNGKWVIAPTSSARMESRVAIEKDMRPTVTRRRPECGEVRPAGCNDR